MTEKPSTISHRRDLWRVVPIPLQGNAAEIGVAEGFFSNDILSWPISFPRVYMVDRWACVPTQKGDASNSRAWHEANLEAAKLRVAPHGDRAVFLQGHSVDMARLVRDQSLSLLYIDGDHSFAGVTADIQAWIPKVVPGGIVAFHDYQAPQYGVKKAVQEYCRGTDRDIFLLPEDKSEDAGAYFIC